MKAVILAAGRGTRLGAGMPKCLVPLADGSRLIDRQVAALTPLMATRDILVVVGFRQELVAAAVPGCTIVANPDFATTNTADSLLRALAPLDDDVLWMNGDVFAAPELVARVAGATDNVVLVKPGAIGDEEVGYVRAPDGAIARLAKRLPAAEGEALGINRVRRADLPALVDGLRAVDARDYFEAAIEHGIAAGRLRFLPLDAGDSFVREMDFPADRAAIDAHLAEGTME